MENEIMLQREQIEVLTRGMEITEVNDIMKDIDELKKILRTEILSTETIALIILLYKKNQEKRL